MQTKSPTSLPTINFGHLTFLLICLFIPLFSFGFVLVDIGHSGLSSPFLMLAVFIGVPIFVIRGLMFILAKIESYTNDKFRVQKLKRMVHGVNYTPAT